MKNTFILFSFTLLLFTFSCKLYAQTDSTIALPMNKSSVETPIENKNISTQADIEKLLKIINRVKIGGVFQGQYVNSLSPGIDYNGKEFGDDAHSSNTFNIKRMRLSVEIDIMKDVKVVVLTNFADFKSDTKTKVLENAYLAYNLNKYFNFRIGQFRPKVGPENSIAVDVVRSLDFSNQYYGFGANGWGSFQVGADVSGKVDLGEIPMTYSLAILNGNGKNATDIDSGKQFSLRNAYKLSKKYDMNVAINGGWGRVSNKDVYVAAIDASTTIPIVPKWSLFLESQVGQGINHNSYFKTASASREGTLSDYVMRGWYALPNLRYEISKPYLNAVEFSCRYEQWEENKLNDNLRQTITPAFTMEFLKNYNLKFTLAMEINRYKHSIAKTNQYNSDILIAQLQARF